jgi:hypothetical protein
MITEQELKMMARTVEEAIKDLEKSKEHDKRDSSKISEWSAKIAIYRIMLQVLHFAQGLTGMLDEDTLKAHGEKLEAELLKINAPKETELFGSENNKAAQQELSILKTKQRTLDYIFGKEKKLL